MSYTDTLPEDITDKVSEDYQVELASLSAEGQQQVYDAVQDQGGADHADVDSLVAQAREADDHREKVEDLHKEQSDAVASGDYAKANDLAHQGEYEIKAVEANGGAGDPQLAQAAKDEQNTNDAVWHQEMAADQAGWARHDAEMGNTVAAEGAAENAADQAHTADVAAGHADQGGTSADHDYSSSASVGETSE